ncbi:Type VI secretion system protein ImpH [Burkholderia sp. 8Y]|uniref:type VI secretion system baseplate subunit TssG n=1 Tax=Burkholderia sp. 8Y TaxID=2653133 RepID=UPI0012F0B8D2|nr:type VI secretion system baseplate subunit TssG [Burkholderia sp. 8Y]VXC32298.1 Type VI secretion system protein ImpH [Burkholderia sp. 8Y]
MERSPFAMRAQDVALSPALLERLQAEPWRFGFLPLLRRIDADARLDPIGTAKRPHAEPFRLGQQPSLIFAPREVASAALVHGKLKIRLFGLGMLGPNGPLPIHVTEIAREREEQRADATLVNFLDVFQHRSLTLLYRAWADAQSTAGLDRRGDERFSFYVASTTGHELKEIEQGPLPSHARLATSPHLVGEARDPGGLGATIAQFFQVPVHVEEYVFQWIALSEARISRLGETRKLGMNAMLGEQVPDRQNRFRIVIGPIDMDAYLRFTPQGTDLLRLVELVRAFVGQKYRWELQLQIKADSAAPAVMGGSEQLGWSTWLGQAATNAPITGMRFEPEDYVPQLRRRARQGQSDANGAESLLNRC